MGPVVVTLIHGTYARGAEWARVTSPIAHALASALPSEVSVCSFNWSGRNSFAHRLAAADALERHVCDLEDLHQGTRHVVVGHSHGGSVIAYWLKQYPQRRTTILGAAFLATPFISVRMSRDWFDVVMMLANSVVTTLILGSGYLLAYLLTFFLPFWAIFAILVIAPFGLIPFAKYVANLIKHAVDRSRKLAVSLSTVDLGTGNFFIARVMGDEASAALHTAQFWAWLLARTRSFVQKSSAMATVIGNLGLGDRTFLGMSVAGLIFTASYLWLWVRYLDEFHFRFSVQRLISLVGDEVSCALAAAVVALVVTTLVVDFILFVVAVASSLTTSLVLSSFGKSEVLLGTLCEVSVESAPIGDQAIFTSDSVMAEIADRRNPSALRHSEVYVSPSVLTAIGTWLRSSFRSSESSISPRRDTWEESTPT